MHFAVHDGDHSERREQVQPPDEEARAAGLPPREQEPEAEADQALRPGHEADLAVDAERLGAGADVRDHLRGPHEHEHRHDGTPLRALEHEEDDEGRGHHELGDAVQGGVEERACLGGPGAGARHRPVHTVAERRDDADDHRPDEMPGDDERHSGNLQQQTDVGHHVGGEAATRENRSEVEEPRRAPSV